MKKFTDLLAWQESHRLALNIYKATKGFPDDERFGLTSQLRRAAVSVPSNIAEGHNRYGDKEKLQFYNIALGSLSEVESQLLLAKDLEYVGGNETGMLLDSIETSRKLLIGLIKFVRNDK